MHTPWHLCPPLTTIASLTCLDGSRVESHVCPVEFRFAESPLGSAMDWFCMAHPFITPCLLASNGLNSKVESEGSCPYNGDLKYNGHISLSKETATNHTKLQTSERIVAVRHGVGASRHRFQRWSLFGTVLILHHYRVAFASFALSPWLPPS